MGTLFGFVQFEFTHAIGPHAGRYVVSHPDFLDEHGAAVRTDELPQRDVRVGVTMKPSTADVLAIAVIGAPPVRPKLLRRSKEAGSPETPADDVPLLLASFIRGTEPLADERSAAAALDAVAASEDQQQAWVVDGLRVVNRAIRAYRAGARDPYVTEVAQRDARRVRIGYGSTEEVAAGDWRRAIVLPPQAGMRTSREERLAPAETTAEVLSGRGRVLEAEEVLLRAWADLDHGRSRAAALQVQAAARLLEVELTEAQADGVSDAVELRERAAALVDTALDEPENDALVDELEGLIPRLERVVERWRYAGLES